MLQSEVFSQGEGDSWFSRNQDYLLSQGADNSEKFEWVSWMAEQLKNQPKHIAELGCANGWRLNRLRQKYPDSQFYGLDASQAAIQDGLARYDKLSLKQGILHQLPWEDQSFDLIIVYSVFMWVDRTHLLASMAEIDRVLCEGGYLIVGDFMPDYPQRRLYHHLPTSNVYTYKQDYAKAFTSLGFYQEVARCHYHHELDPTLNFQAVESSDRFGCALLQKNLLQGYPIV